MEDGSEFIAHHNNVGHPPFYPIFVPFEREMTNLDPIPREKALRDSMQLRANKPADDLFKTGHKLINYGLLMSV